MSALMLGVIFVVLRGGELWAQMREFLTTAPTAWAAALVMFLGLHAFGAYKWRLFLKLSGARIGRLQAVRFYGSGLFANLCLPSLIGGDVLRAGMALGVCENKGGVVLGSFVDRLADLCALGVLVFLGGMLSVGGFETLEENSIGGAVILTGYLSAMGIVVATMLYVLQLRTVRKLPRKWSRHLVSVLRGIQTLKQNPIEAAFGFCACLVVQAGFVFINSYVGKFMGIELGLELWILLWPLAKIIAMLPISLGGLGVREIAFAGLVAPFGVAEELAVAQSLIWQSVLVVGGIIAGVFSFLTRSRA